MLTNRATSIPDFFEHNPIYLGLSGYLVMRLGMVVMWLRAAAGDPGHRRTTLRFALGVALLPGLAVSALRSGAQSSGAPVSDAAWAGAVVCSPAAR